MARERWMRCYRCWSHNLEVQLRYEAAVSVDIPAGRMAATVDEAQEAVVWKKTGHLRRPKRTASGHARQSLRVRHSRAARRRHGVDFEVRSDPRASGEVGQRDSTPSPLKRSR